jgi:hypothetical protein
MSIILIKKLALSNFQELLKIAKFNESLNKIIRKKIDKPYNNL